MIRWIEGWSAFGTPDNSASGLGAKYTVGSGTHTIRAGRTSDTLALELSNAIFQNHAETPNLGAMGTIVVGFAFRVAALGSNYRVVELRDGSTVHLHLTYLTSGEWQVVHGNATVLGTTTGASNSPGVWQYVELRVLVDDSGSVELRVNGVARLTLPTVDTRNGGNASADRVRFAGSFSAADDTTLADIYIDDANFHGSKKVVGIRPNDVGDESDFTPTAGDNYENVETNDGDTSYVESGTPDDTDLYQYGDVAGANIKAVMISTIAKHDGTPTDLHSVVKSGSSQSDGSAVSLGDDYAAVTRVIEVDPDTGQPWEEGGLNAAQFGVKVG